MSDVCSTEPSVSCPAAAGSALRSVILRSCGRLLVPGRAGPSARPAGGVGWLEMWSWPVYCDLGKEKKSAMDSMDQIL